MASMHESYVHNKKNSFVHNKKTFLEKKLYDVGLMIDHDVAEKRYEIKVGMSS